MTYQIAANRMTLSELQGHSLTVGLSKCYFSYSCAAVDKIISDIVRRLQGRIKKLGLGHRLRILYLYV